MKWLYIINELKLGLLHKKIKIKIKNRLYFKNLLLCLLKINFIKSFKIKNSMILIEFSFTNKNLLYKNIINFYNLRNKKMFRLKFLKKFHYMNSNSFYILSTSKGFLTHNEAIINNVGGIIFFKLTA